MHESIQKAAAAAQNMIIEPGHVGFFYNAILTGGIRLAWSTDAANEHEKKAFPRFRRKVLPGRSGAHGFDCWSGRCKIERRHQMEDTYMGMKLRYRKVTAPTSCTISNTH